MHQLAVLSMGWAAFFHPASISQYFLVSDQLFFWGWFFLNPDFHITFPPGYPTDPTILLT
jgi:hypothetical protein